MSQDGSKLYSSAVSRLEKSKVSLENEKTNLLKRLDEINESLEMIENNMKILDKRYSALQKKEQEMQKKRDEFQNLIDEIDVKKRGRKKSSKPNSESNDDVDVESNVTVNPGTIHTDVSDEGTFSLEQEDNFLSEDY